ncbi:uncharacterized protein [Miscanthus floridulus]|uniref:uncharacterized protein n=1 Tax=Miscanthus floridulus TaxID=154761 RepID=UPI003459CB07
MQERRRQGLCYNCDEQYVRGHVCPSLFFLEADDFLNDDVEGAADDAAAALPEEAAAVADAHAHALVVSVHALAGIRTFHTMLLPVTIKGERLLALLDIGSTHTFLQCAAMRRLGLAPQGGDQLRVTVANGERVPCEGIARDVPVNIYGAPFSITCVGLALGCFDFILGVDFLGTLGPLTWDFEGLTMSFLHEGRHITWRCVGTPGAPSQQRSLAAVASDLHHPLLDELLIQHDAVFDTLRGLPPARPYDHRIHLLPGTAQVAVQPYRYPQLQKDELER